MGAAASITGARSIVGHAFQIEQRQQREFPYVIILINDFMLLQGQFVTSLNEHDATLWSFWFKEQIPRKLVG